MKQIESIKKYMYYKTKKIELPFYPDRLYMELTNVCNFNCIMCPNGRGLMTRDKGFMDYKLATNIIDEMGPHIDTIVLHIWGESLLHPRIFDIINHCQQYNVKTELSTNTSLLNKHISRNIIDSGLSKIYLCIDGATKETYEHVRKNGDYETSVNNVVDFLEIKNKKTAKSPATFLQIISMNATHNDIDDFKRKWSIKGVDRIDVKPLDTWGGQIPEINLLTNHKNNGIKRFHCPNIWYHAHIYFDGSLVCCDRDFDATNPLGNVKNGVMKAWNGNKMQELRRRHIEQSLDAVQSCSNCCEWSWWRPTLFTSWGNMPKKVK